MKVSGKKKGMIEINLSSITSKPAFLSQLLRSRGVYDFSLWERWYGEIFSIIFKRGLYPFGSKIKISEHILAKDLIALSG